MAIANKQFSDYNFTIKDSNFSDIKIMSIERDNRFLFIDVICKYKTNNDSVNMSEEFGSEYSEVNIDALLTVYQTIVINSSALKSVPQTINLNDLEINVNNVEFEDLVIYNKDELIDQLGDDFEIMLEDNYEDEINKDANHYQLSESLMIERL